MEITPQYTLDRRSALMRIVPVMMCFFVMGFVDLAGTVGAYAWSDFSLTPARAAMLPVSVFIWFVLLPVPVCRAMAVVGRKAMVLWGLVMNIVAMLLAASADGFETLLAACSLLGMANAVLQTSLNPLVAILSGPARMTGTLTLGQFIKAVASFLAPVLALWGADAWMPTFGLGWRVLFVVYAAVSFLCIALLGATPVEGLPPVRRGIKIKEVMAVPGITAAVFAIVCHVGIDVGTNATAPHILAETLGLDAARCAGVAGMYFVARTVGCLFGAMAVQRLRTMLFLGIGCLMIAAGAGALLVSQTFAMLLVAVALIGAGNSCVFPVILSEAFRRVPGATDTVAALMVMSLAGGAVIAPLLASVASVGGVVASGLVLLVATGAMAVACRKAVR